MGLLTGELPDTVSVAGAEHPIRTDFRISIEFELLVQNHNIQEKDKILRALSLYYPRIPGDIKGACEKLIWFYRCGKEESGQDETDLSDSRRIYDFDYDADYIYAAFLEQYGIDLTGIEHLHWWKFRVMFWGLDDNCEFVKIMGYRGMKIPSKMPKEQKAFYRKMKQIYALPLPKDEQQKNDAITAALMNGGDVSGLLLGGGQD